VSSNNGVQQQGQRQEPSANAFVNEANNVNNLFLGGGFPAMPMSMPAMLNASASGQQAAMPPPSVFAHLSNTMLPPGYDSAGLNGGMMAPTAYLNQLVQQQSHLIQLSSGLVTDRHPRNNEERVFSFPGTSTSPANMGSMIDSRCADRTTSSTPNSEDSGRGAGN